MTHSCSGVVAWNKGLKGVTVGYWAGKKRPDLSAKVRGRKKPSITGKNHYRWIEDRTQINLNQQRYVSNEHKNWRNQIFTRDGFKCKIKDGNCNGRIEAHHILPWSKYPELRNEINNGITLCHYHHPRKGDEVVKLAPVFQGMVNNYLAN